MIDLSFLVRAVSTVSNYGCIYPSLGVADALHTAVGPEI